MTKKPAIVFKYERASLQSLQNLKQQSFYFASPTCFNDPYDCTISLVVDEPTEAEFEVIRSHMASESDRGKQVLEEAKRRGLDVLRNALVSGAENMIRDKVNDFLAKKGVACFSERKDNLLMWSHYGGSHQGYCLEFRTDSEAFSKLRQVKYVEAMPRINLCDFYVHQRYDALIELYCTKSAAWQYEKEWRILHQKANTLYTYEDDTLKAVYFGPKMKHETKEIICLILNGQNPNVEFWNATQKPDRFELTFNKVNYTSHNDAKRQGLA